MLEKPNFKTNSSKVYRIVCLKKLKKLLSRWFPSRSMARIRFDMVLELDVVVTRTIQVTNLTIYFYLLSITLIFKVNIQKLKIHQMENGNHCNVYIE